MNRLFSENQAAGATVLSRLDELRHSAPEIGRLIGELSKLGAVLLVGGAVRDWLAGRTPRDLDLVVDVDSSALAARLSASISRRTRYGGIHVASPTMPVDVWSLRSTWAFGISGAPSPSPRNLPRTAFYNYDAVAVSVQTGEVFECGFFDGLERRVLSVQFERNPFPELCAARGFCLAHAHGLTLDRSVVDFIAGLAASGLRWDQLLDAQRSHYGAVRVDSHDMAQFLPSSVAKTLGAKSGDSYRPIERGKGVGN